MAGIKKIFGKKNYMIKKNIFLNSKKWENNKNIIGLPRPFIDVPNYFINNKSLSFSLPKKIPIPWQSKPILNIHAPKNSVDFKVVFNIINENEDLIYKNNLCGYCGIPFEKNEYCIRWKSKDKKPKKLTTRVLSDIHPLHLECMKEARIFCPHMKKTIDTEYEYGTYTELRKNADEYIK
jgi:hypothetical protein